jgi:hypothetical protein
VRLVRHTESYHSFPHTHADPGLTHHAPYNHSPAYSGGPLQYHRQMAHRVCRLPKMVQEYGQP